MNETPAVRLERVCKNYVHKGREVPALAGVSASVGEGQLAALVGPNGAGKTTALRIIATLVRPSSGRGFVFGSDVVTEQSAVRRSIGVSLGTGRSFYWRLSARHNLAFFARLKGISSGRIAAEIMRLAAELDLERFLARPARSLSRGALARLSVARACLGEPRLLVLDEPFASVDERARELLWGALKRRARSGRSVVLATHDPAVASRCDLVIELGGGRVGA
ncbi:MAG: ABC transporter ATP-binding protein [Candidatus Eisenbacteria bacterium]